MPIYQYEPVEDGSGCGVCREGFEFIQRLSEDALEACPTCRNTVRRVLGAVRTPRSEADLLSDRNVGEKGFARYQKVEPGVYERTAGEGPDTIKR